jgi:hypothetical protein
LAMFELLPWNLADVPMPFKFAHGVAVCKQSERRDTISI